MAAFLGRSCWHGNGDRWRSTGERWHCPSGEDMMAVAFFVAGKQVLARREGWHMCASSVCLRWERKRAFGGRHCGRHLRPLGRKQWVKLNEGIIGWTARSWKLLDTVMVRPVWQKPVPHDGGARGAKCGGNTGRRGKMWHTHAIPHSLAGHAAPSERLAWRTPCSSGCSPSAGLVRQTRRVSADCYESYCQPSKVLWARPGLQRAKSAQLAMLATGVLHLKGRTMLSNWEAGMGHPIVLNVLKLLKH